MQGCVGEGGAVGGGGARPWEGGPPGEGGPPALCGVIWAQCLLVCGENVMRRTSEEVEASSHRVRTQN